MSKPKPKIRIAKMSKPEKDVDDKLRKEAWVGDAILALYVREWILADFGQIDGKLFIEFTSNDFLRRSGKPTAVEAQIGRIFKSDGLEAAYAWIEEHLRPKMQERIRNYKAGFKA